MCVCFNRTVKCCLSCSMNDYERDFSEISDSKLISYVMYRIEKLNTRKYCWTITNANMLTDCGK